MAKVNNISFNSIMFLTMFKNIYSLNQTINYMDNSSLLATQDLYITLKVYYLNDCRLEKETIKLP